MKHRRTIDFSHQLGRRRGRRGLRAGDLRGLDRGREPVASELRVAEAGATIDVEPGGPCFVAASAGVLTLVVANLGSNAIEYLGDGVERRIVFRVLDAGACARRGRGHRPGIPAYSWASSSAAGPSAHYGNAGT